MRLNLPKIKYNQTWEDFYVDAEVLEIDSQDTVVAISSAGCNILNLALKSPSKIFAVDINPGQNFLLRLKIAAIHNLEYPEFWRLFGEGQSEENLRVYRKKLREIISRREQSFWDKNINIFKTGIFVEGKLGSFRYLRGCLFKLCGKKNLETFINIQDLPEQRKFYLQNIEPKLWHLYSSCIPTPTMIIYGVHPRQIYLNLKKHQFFLKNLFKLRFKDLFTSVPIHRNYFWHQIILGGYRDRQCCPPYLKKDNFARLKKSLETIQIHSCSITRFLKSQKEKSITKFNLSDIPEFLSKKERETLWYEVFRVAKNRAIFIYRSFSLDFFPPKSFEANFKYYKNQSDRLTTKEMTGSYAQVYKYEIIK